MGSDRFGFRISKYAVLIFWVIILLVFLGIYFFNPSLLNRMRQASYQETPFVNTPLGS